MKNLKNKPQHLLFAISIIIFMMGSNLLDAQLTTWELGPASDWNASFVIEGPTDAQCPCLGGAEDHITVYSTSISNPEFEITRPHEQGSWGTTVVIEIGPNSNVTRQGRVGVQNAFQHQNGINCSAICGLTNIGPSMTFTTEALRPPQNVIPVINANGTVTINWDVTTDIPDAIYALAYGWNGILLGNFDDKSTTTMTICPISDNATFSIWTVAVGFSESEKKYIPMTQGPVPGGTMNGFVETLSGNAVGGVIVKATLQNPEVFGDCLTPTVYISEPSQTSNGQYSISGIKYHSNLGPAIYDVQAFLAGHEFRTTPDTSSIDSIQTFGLTTNLNDFDNVDFFDIKTYDVLGKVVVDGDCGLGEVQLIANGPGNSMTQTLTEGDGSFKFIFIEVGDYDIIAKYDNIPFYTVEINVSDNVVLPDILYATSHTISGFSGAGCLEVIGQMTIEARTPTGCTIASVTTNPSGFYEMILPEIPLEVQVVDYDPQDYGFDYNIVYPKIDSVYEIDFDSTLTLNIQYRKPIQIDVEGLPPAPCPSVEYPVLNQDQEYTFTINIWESLDICRADTGMVTISDDVSTFGVENPIITEAEFAKGRIQYTLRAGDPALSAPFLKYINITAYVDNEVATLSIPVIVSGTRIRTSTITSAPSDSIPFLILRDPPGDGSQAWFSETNMTSYSQSFSHEVGGSVKLWAKARPSFFGAIWGEIAGSLEVGGSRKSATESTVTLETTTEIRTKATNAFIGEDGDLIMGAAVNFKYGLSDDRFFDLNTCAIVVDTSLVFSPETFESTYIHSVSFIKGDIIPKLEFLSQNQDTTEAARRKFASKLRVWEQILQLNRDQKEAALKNPISTFSFDAGTEWESTITGSSSRQSSLEFTTNIDANLALSAGVKVTHFEGSAGVDVNIRSSWGNSTSLDTLMSTTTGYKFADDDMGDSHYFNFAIDSVYGTPVFGVIGGASSCPHEDNTQFIDLMKLTIANPTFIGGQGEELAIFPFTVQNLGETDASNTYMLDFIEQSNPNSAIVTVNGSINPVFYNLGQGASDVGEIRVTRPSGNQYTFEGLQFDFFTACLADGNPYPDKSIQSTAYVSAYFMNNCSGINLTAPANNWLINTASNNMIPITMDHYILGNIDQIKLMYANQKDGIWKASNINIPGGNLQVPPQNYMWDVSNLKDGKYTIRWELTCGPTLNWSPRVTGTIDRSAPRVFGVEKPVTDLYFPGDEISVQFNEAIDYSFLDNSHIYMKAIPEGTMFPVSIQGDGNEVIIVPNGDISELYNQTFEVGVFGVVDLFGNVKTDTAKWEFVVSEPDSDRDGVTDTKDRCPGGDDFKDTDMDGLPDDCDCVPTIKTNGRTLTKAAMDFDGVDDYIEIPHHADFNDYTQGFTFEAWVNTKDKTKPQTILSKGDGSNGNTSYIFAIRQNKLALFIGGGGNDSTWLYANTDIKEGVWTHAAVTYEPNIGAFFFVLDGVFDGIGLIAHGLFMDSSPVYIGKQGHTCNCNFLEAKLEEVRIWNIGRDENDIIPNMHIELTGLEPGLVAYHNFNEGTPFGDNNDLSIAKDQTLNNNDGTLSGFTKSGVSSNWVPSPVSVLDVAYDLCKNCTDTLNTAMDFDGINDHIEIPYDAVFNPGINKSFTMEAWVKADNGYVAQTILSKGAGSGGNTSYIFSLYQNKIALFVGDGGGSVTWLYSDTDVTFNKWMHVAVSYDHITGIFTFFLNGAEDGTRTIAHGFYAGDSPVYIGRQGQTCNCNLYKGKMDDLRFWNTARTQAEIGANLYTELIGDESGLVTYYDFNNGEPSLDNDTLTVVPDVSGNAHDGTLANFNQFGGFSNWVKSPLRFAGDADEDGLPDICDNCIPALNLMLENVSLNGIYRARDKITLGNGVTFPPNADVTFRTPLLELFDGVDAPVGVKVLVNPEPCEQE